MTTATATRAYSFAIGAIQCTIVSDGSMVYPEPASLFFANAPRAACEPALRAHGIDVDLWHEYVSPYSALYLETGSAKLLVDTGAGGFAPTNGKLFENLRAEGIDPASVDYVVLTHAHPDHIGGNLDAEQRPAFPNARYALWRDEWEFWTGEPDLSTLAIPDALKALLLESARRNLPPIEAQMQLFESERELAPGVRAIAAPGHTPGHLIVVVQSGEERLLWTGDALLHPIHVEHPEWYSAFDLVPELAVATRRHLLARAADEGMLVHGAHFPWPGLGHIRRRQDGFTWEKLHG